LNMKKSWHPLLLKNQERVWLEEKKALEEKKKYDQLRKEKEEERQLQKLQRLQEEQTGKKRTEKLEWMYTTPATGNSQNPNDLEDYLLGKKRVDKILVADDNAKLGATHTNFIAVQNANSVRDITAKVREDPLLAIKQQEQAAYQALLSNPLRLKKMQEELGIKPKKDKEKRKLEKEERKRLKQERKHRRDRSSSMNRYSRTPSPSLRGRNRSLSPVHDTAPKSQRHRSYSRTPSPEPSHSRKWRSERSKSPRRDKDYHNNPYRSGLSQSNGHYDRREDDRTRRYGTPPPHLDNGKRSRSPSRGERSPPPKRSRYSPPQNDHSNRYTQNESDRVARLAAMQSNATTMTGDRQKRLQALLEKEKAELEADQRAREKSKGVSNFLSQEQKRVFGGSGGLEDRIRRGRNGLVVDAD